MPRAKRTDRAEARRRHRASLDAAAGGDESEVEEPLGATDSGRGASRVPAARPAPAIERPSIGSAFRAAFRPVTLREDLRTFPPLLKDKSVWLPILLTIAAGVVFMATGGANPLVAIVATYFIAPPALGSVFLAGFLAPRSSYLIGFVVGLVSAAVASAIVLAAGPALAIDGGATPGASSSPAVVASAPAASPGSSLVPIGSPSPAAASPSQAPGATPGPSASATPGATPARTTSTQDQIIYAFLTSPPFGMFFAATAAWYRRFLRLSSPNRNRPVQRRGPDGRSRGNQRSRR